MNCDTVKNHVINRIVKSRPPIIPITRTRPINPMMLNPSRFCCGLDRINKFSFYRTVVDARTQIHDISTLMVGKLLFFWVLAYVERGTVSFRECIGKKAPFGTEKRKR